jgi:nitrate/nitrite transporter NarK
MIPAGRMQDKMGPSIVATIGGILVGIGFVISSMTTSLIGFIFGFGILAGAGIGFGYASATPPAVKWFPAAKTGLIAGIVVSGFGLASAYAAPLTEWLLITQGFTKTLLILGIAFLIVISGIRSIWTFLYQGFAHMLESPPKGYVPKEAVKKKTVHDKDNLTPTEMLCTPQFYMLWFMYACGAGAGLMIISVAKKIVAAEIADTLAIVAVMGLAVGNGGGRIIAGILSDKIGRKLTLFVFFVLQAVLLVFLSQAQGGSVLASAPVLILLASLIGANYGSNLSLFPSITKDYYGVKNFGMNYGFVFTAWGFGGFLLSKLAGFVYDKTQSFNFAYFCASGLLVLAALMVFALKHPHHSIEAVGEESSQD